MALTVVALVVWGIAGFGMMTPQQSRLGSVMSGALLDTLGLTHLAWIRVPFALLALLTLAFDRRAAPFTLMILGMRFYVLALMMVLLPLRGWTGDAMATDMAVNAAAQQMHQTTNAVTKADSHQGHQSHEDHSNHAAHETLTKVTTSTTDCLIHADCDQTHHAGHSAGDCESCSACQACHNVPLLVDSDELKPSLNSLWTTTKAVDPFASADSAHDQKPPIS